ncbi:helix-turn-helix transcriptional regulator [Streptomyces sp. NPDC050204]|uniref:helix-turn-helix transcriptional regulator n=1 Tax=Streptomyces sp. NPDC050204 TaxID=3155514 RepID=UPI003418D787
MREGEWRPLPTRVLKHPEMVDACRDRDFGRIFKLSEKAGLYPSRIARQCDMTPSRVSEIISGKRALTQLHVIERVADGIGIPGAMLGLAARPWESDSVEEPAVKQDVPASAGEARPRVIAPQSLQVAIIPPDPVDDDALDLMRHLASASTADGTVARLYSTQVDTMRQMDRQVGATRVLPQLEMQIQQMEDLLRYGTAPGGRRPLAAALTEAATLAGWMALDLGKYQTSWRLHETAKAAAWESGSAALVAHAMGQQAYVLLDLGEAAKAAEQMRFARENSGRGLPALMESWLFAAEAEAHAVAGHDAECRTGMDRAEEVRPNDPVDPALPFLFLGGSHLDRWRGNVLATLGADEALADLTASLASMDLSGFTRAEAGVRCDLAVVMARRGEREEARRQALRAQDLAQLTSSVRQRRRIAQVLAVTAD